MTARAGQARPKVLKIIERELILKQFLPSKSSPSEAKVLLETPTSCRRKPWVFAVNPAS